MTKKKAGRPLGTTKGHAKRDQAVGLKLTEQGKAWLDKKPRGWLADWVEAQAKSITDQPSLSALSSPD